MSSLTINTRTISEMDDGYEQRTHPGIIRVLAAGLVCTLLMAYMLDRLNPDHPFQPSVILLAGLGVVFGSLLVLADSRAGISVFILTSCISPRMAGNFRMEDLLLPAIVLVWLGRVSRGDMFRLRTPVTVPLVLVAVTMILTFIWGQGQGTNENPTEGLFIIFKRIEYGILFVFALNSIRTQRDAMTLILIFLGGAILAAAISLGTADPDTRVGDTRVTGLDAANYNTFAGFLVIAASLAIAHAGQYRGKVRLALAITAVVLISTLLKTYSREGYFMLAIAVGALGILRYRALIVIVVLMAAFSQWIVPETILDRVGDSVSNLENYQTASAGSNSFTARVGGWTNRWRMFEKQPVFGNGPGSAPLKIDNEYLLRLIESGILGLAAFLYLVFACGYYLVVCIKRLRGSESEAFAYGMLAAYIAVLVQGMVSAAWSTIRTMEPFWIMAGAVGGLVIHREIMKRKSDDLNAAESAPSWQIGRA